MVTAPAADAAFPGANGKIAFQFNDAVIGVMNADGTNETTITSPSAGHDRFPAWSPDGSKIAFSSSRDTCVSNPDVCNSQIYTINADGTNLTRITNDPFNESNPAWSPDGSKIAVEAAGITVFNADGTNPTPLTSDPEDASPAWSPDGTKIAFSPSRDGNREVYVMNADGTNQTNLTNNLGQDGSPSWSPDGTKIAFTSSRDGYVAVYTMNADGTNQTRLNNSSAANGGEPVWSPDGTKIAFDSSRDGNSEIYTMKPDGTNQTRITNTSAWEAYPDWQPIPINTYPRPKGATPFKTFLVPAFKQCTAVNRTHGAPLAFPSCSLPQQTSSYLTVGTPDSNGLAASSRGFVQYTTILGNPSTPANEADLQIDVSIVGVLNKLDRLPYSGQLSADAGLRITDKNNTASSGGPGAATVQDRSFPVTVPCTSSSCAISTTANALVPGAVLEGKRAIWQLGQVKVYDGGSDGLASTTADNMLFMDQGVFIP
jgi:WD40 repeat protein